MKEKIKKVITKAIDNKIFPGCALGVIKNNRRFVFSFGCFTDNPALPKTKEDSIFDVASITKAIPTACLALKLIEEKRLRLNDRLIKYVPEYTGRYYRAILIRHLLTQTLEFGFRFSKFKNLPQEKLFKRMLRADLVAPPGRYLSYSNITSNLLGLVLERIYRTGIDSTAEKNFFRPLKMERTGFRPERFPYDEVVPTEIDPWRKKLVWREVHDETTWKLRPKVMGATGLFSSAPDLLNFMEMLLSGGKLGKKRFFLQETVEMMHGNQLGHIGQSHGFGWEIRQPQYMGDYVTNKAFGKTGFTGCLFLADPGKKSGLIMLSNYVYPVRKMDATLINRVRRDIANIVFSE